MKKISAFSRLRGFTLMETLLAVALVGVMLSIFLTVF
ncbi:MAG: prepilin-type N-terminal cleavage/methylation domain-containing protein, partial [Akkermansia sp.]|nr:prepilin-type N-terminal cleavage/methylation domain-containing protein [Akkermansia sp.]